MQGAASSGEWLPPQFLASPDEDVEGDVAGGDLLCELPDTALRRMEPGLHGVEVEDPVAVDDDLAVEGGVGRKELRERPELGEVAEQGARVPRPEPELAGAVLEQAPEPVPLRLVLPPVARWKLPHELRLHRREWDPRIEVGRSLDRALIPSPTWHSWNLPRPL